MNITVISFGRQSSDAYDKEIERYSKMASSWGKLSFSLLKPIPMDDKNSGKILQKESDLIRKQWSGNIYRIALAEEGKSFTSQSFAQHLQKETLHRSNIILTIGSAYGLDKSIKEEADLLLSLSPMTMPFKLCRLVLAEQLYRTMSIINGHPYHK